MMTSLFLLATLGSAFAGEGASAGAAADPKVGPFLIRDDHGNTMQLQLVSQWTVGWIQSDPPAEAAEATTQARLRRLRLFHNADLLGGELRYSVQLSLAPRAAELLDLWVEPKVAGDWRFRFGQFKTPYTRYRMNSFTDLQLVDWSIVTMYFGDERQIGAMLHNGWRGGTPLELQVGVFTGQNARRSHGIAAPLLYAQPRPSPSDLVDPSAPFPELHPELVAHVGWSSEKMDVSRWDDTDGGGPRLHLGASVSQDLQPVYGQDMTTRLAGEGLLKVHHVSLGAVGYAATFPTIDEDTSLGLLGGLAELSVRVASRHTVAVRGALIDVQDGLEDDIAAAFAAAPSGGPLVVEGSPAIIQQERELTVGWKGDLLGTTVQLFVDGVYTQQDATAGTTDGLQLRSQLQTKF